MTEISGNLEVFFFHLIFVGSPFFFKILKALQLKKSYDENFCPHGNCFKKIDYIWKSCFQKLVFDKWQMKWHQTKKRKLQEEIQKSLDKVVKEHWEICSMA